MGDPGVWLVVWLYGMIALGCASGVSKIGGDSVSRYHYWACGLFWPYGLGLAIANLALKEDLK